MEALYLLARVVCISITYPTVSDQASEDKSLQDHKSYYKQITMPSSSRSPQQSPLSIYNSPGKILQSNQWLFPWLWGLSYAEASKTLQSQAYG